MAPGSHLPTVRVSPVACSVVDPAHRWQRGAWWSLGRRWILLAVLLSAAPVLQAQVVDEYEPGLTLRPEVAMAADGSFVVVWSDMNHVYAQLYTPLGVPVLGEPIEVEDEVPTQNTGLEDLHSHDVASNAAGNFVVAWTGAWHDRRRDRHIFKHHSTSGPEHYYG